VPDLALVDDLAVRATLSRYCHRCDDGDVAGVVALFTPDGVFSFRQDYQGSAALAEFFQSSQGRPEQRGRHLTVNTVVEPDGDGARAVSDFLFFVLGDSGPVPAILGRYHDTLVRLDGRWRIARREVLIAEKPA
jgi:ketosteroid isomerase-like protein